MDWPWPEDSKDDRHHRILESYRHALMKADPVGCRQLDEQMTHFEQGWVCGAGGLVGNDELKSAKELAALYDMPVRTFYDWARRHPDLLPKHKRGGRVLFRVGDVLAYRTTTHG